jgi:leader peptidase (prepilin peptidase)/N-methyltransferase
MQHRIIPDEVTIGGMLIGFLLRLFSGLNLSGRKWSLAPALDSCLGIIIGGGIIWLVGFLFDLIYFKLLRNPPIQGETESMGGGDVKLLAMIGAFLGWQQALVTFFLAPFFGALIGIINLLTNKDHTIPYGPFLSLAAFICIFWFQAILGFIFLVH